MKIAEMKTVYQHCSQCKSSQVHSWTSELILTCNKCQKDNRISPIDMRPKNQDPIKLPGTGKKTFNIKLEENSFGAISQDKLIEERKEGEGLKEQLDKIKEPTLQPMPKLSMAERMAMLRKK